MGSHVAPAFKYPPTLWDRSTIHAVEVMVCIYGLFEAVKVVVIGLTAGLESHLALLPIPLLAVLVLFVGGGSAIAIKGLIVRCEDLRREINVEQVGWALLGLGWLGYGVGSDILNPGVAVASDIGYALAVAGAWRFYGLRRIEKHLDRVVEAIDRGEATARDTPEEASP